MKNFFKFGLIAILASGIFLGCKKKEEVIPDPVSCFTTSTTTVMAGESFTATNCSQNATSYLWEDGDGSSSANTNEIITYPNTGTYTLKLTAQGNGKQHVTSKTITVVPAMGEATFWQSGTPAYATTNVTIGGVTKQITVDKPNGVSDCNNNGCANFDLAPGTYYFSANDGTYSWTGYVTVTFWGCETKQLL